MPTDVAALTELVKTAKQATEGLDNKDLQRVAFERVLDHLLKNGAADDLTSNAGGPASVAAAGALVEDRADGVFADEQQRIDAVATYFKIDPEDVPHLFDVSGEVPALILHTSSFSTEKAVATREITLLVTGVRTAIGQKTATNDIRKIVDDFGRLDSSDFMTTLANMKEISILGKACSPNRVVRMKVPGVERARELVERFIGEYPGWRTNRRAAWLSAVGTSPRGRYRKGPLQ